MDIKLGDKVVIKEGTHRGKSGIVVDIPREYEAPDRFYIVDVNGFRAEVPESALAKDRTLMWVLLGFAIGTAVAAVLVRGGV